MRIAICDDNQKMCRILTEYIRDYMKNGNLLYDLDCFNSAEHLLENIHTGGNTYDIYFLDICLEQMDGMQLAEDIRSDDIYALIVFVTGSDEHMHSAFGVHAYNYLLKPITRDKFNECLDEIMKLKSSKAKLPVLTTKGDSTEAPIYNIIVIESSGNRSQIFTVKNEYYNYKTLEELQEVLPDSFARCHKGFIVNMDYISKIYYRECLLHNKRAIPIGRTYVGDFKNRYFTYLRKKVD